MHPKCKATIAVISVTRNCKRDLPALVKSLRLQTDKNFIWIIQDCTSSDGTLDLIKSITDIEISLVSVRDNGIYDGLNRALKRCQAEYYLVVGSDDTLDKYCIENFKKIILSDKFDIVAASLIFGSIVIKPKKYFGWLYGMRGVASGHSVGTLIATQLHDKLGPYTNKYRIVADQYFIKSAIKSGAKVERVNFISGKYGNAGISSRNLLECFIEFTIMQFETERIKSIQIMLFITRLIKNYKKLFI